MTTFELDLHNKIAYLEDKDKELNFLLHLQYDEFLYVVSRITKGHIKLIKEKIFLQ